MVYSLVGQLIMLSAVVAVSHTKRTRAVYRVRLVCDTAKSARPKGWK